MFAVFALAFALSGALQGGALQGDAVFDEGMRLYKGLEYEQAILQFEEVALRPALPAGDKAQALMWLGLSYAGAGDLEAARRNFRSALVIDLELALPPATAPHVATMFEDARKQAAEARARQAAATPASTPVPADTPPPESGGNTPLLVAGVASTALGVIGLVGGGVFGVLTYLSLQTANDPDAFQTDAKDAVDAANQQVIGAAVLLPLGAVLAGVGGVLLFLSMGE